MTPVASEVVPSDNSSTVAGVSWLDGVNAAVPVSTQPEAEAGVNSTKRMTPLTTKQAIDAQVPPKISTAIGALNLGSASQASVGDFATAVQGSKADSAVQPSDLAEVATSGDYEDLVNKPTARLLPSGGLTSQALIKRSDADYDTEWVTSAAATSVSYAPQILTEPQQSQARTNISAASPFRAAIGGTANAVTLTDAAPIAVGLMVRFRATAMNTDTVTIAYNGGPPIASRTIAGVALPAGYIRADVDTEAVYDGTYWVVNREIESGSNANGEYVRFANGTQECLGEYTSPSLAMTTTFWGGFVSAFQTVTLPAAFVAILPSIGVSMRSDGANSAFQAVTQQSTGQYGSFNVGFVRVDVDSFASAKTISFVATGRWY